LKAPEKANFAPPISVARMPLLGATHMATLSNTWHEHDLAPTIYPTVLCHVRSRRKMGRWKAGSDVLGAAASRRRARSGGWSISRGGFLPPATDNSNGCRLSVCFAAFCGSAWRPFHRESSAGGRSAVPRAIPSVPVSRTVFATDRPSLGSIATGQLMC
jgi:hypothetical protein